MLHFLRLRKRALAVASVLLVCLGGLASWRICRMYQGYFGDVPSIVSQQADFSDLSDETLSHYYLHARGGVAEAIESGMWSNPPFDDNGIPLHDYGGNVGRQYSATRVSNYALANWELFLQGDEEKHRTTFLRQADWLVENQEDGKWHVRCPNEVRGLEPPWISGMTQGLGLSVLLRAYQLTGDSGYLAAAQKAFSVYQIPIDCGGVVYRTENGTWIEEYPNASQPTHVLNGHIWALFGVWDMWRVTKAPEALALFNQGIAVLKADLGKYDTGFWVRYDQPPPDGHLMDSAYMHRQVDQLRVLYAITDEPIFATYAAKWDGYRRNKGNLWRIICHNVPRRVRIALGL